MPAQTGRMSCKRDMAHPQAEATNQPIPVADLENRFLEAIETKPLPSSQLLRLLQTLLSLGASDTARSCADLLQSELIAQGEGDTMLTLCRLTAEPFDNDPAYAPAMFRALRRLFKSREHQAFLEASGLGKPPTAPALRRFEWLLQAQPGKPCLDKHRGFGRVQEIDAFLGRMLIDFIDRPGQAIPFAHAADALEWLPPEHLLTRRHLDPVAFAAWRDAEPDALVKQALRDFGPLSVSRLETVLTDHDLLAGKGWKPFWEQARKVLKADTGVSIPVKRTEPISIQPETERFGDAWFAALSSERHAPALYAHIAEWAESGGKIAALKPSALDVLKNRLAFALEGAAGVDDCLSARLTLLTAKLALDDFDVGALLKRFAHLDTLLRVGVRLNVREAEALTRALLDADPDVARGLIQGLERLPFAMIDTVVDWATVSPLQDECTASLRERLHDRDPTPALLAWGLRHRLRLQAQGLIDAATLLTHAVAVLDMNLSGENLRMQNMIRRYFVSGRDLTAALSAMSALQREALYNRLRSLADWDATEKRGVLARLIKAHPELGELAARESAAAADHAPPPRLTSWRSYHARRAQLKRLIDVDIPANSREIGQARSYGDLRENFEYHAARHQQGLLMQRRAELERDLEQVRGTDFADVSVEQAAQGTTVVVAGPDGRKTRYTILGEWDRDADLGILSSESRVAQCLLGHGPGDRVDLPSADEQAQTVQIRAIEPLNAAIRRWIGGPDPAPSPSEATP